MPALVGSERPLRRIPGFLKRILAHQMSSRSVAHKKGFALLSEAVLRVELTKMHYDVHDTLAHFSVSSYIAVVPFGAVPLKCRVLRLFDRVVRHRAVLW